GNPSSWAFMQDIGGKSTSAVYGWGNMWGNFGAAFIAILVPRLLSWGESAGYGNQPVFFVCGGAFFLAAFAALAMDATRQVTA
ncbi:MAG: MFS transporter, partial [Phycisphaerae bacterium]